jgi:hypothetical protein
MTAFYFQFLFLLSTGTRYSYINESSQNTYVELVAVSDVMFSHTIGCWVSQCVLNKDARTEGIHPLLHRKSVPKPVPTIVLRSLMLHSYVVQQMGANRVETEAACHAKLIIKCCSVTRKPA